LYDSAHAANNELRVRMENTRVAYNIPKPAVYPYCHLLLYCRRLCLTRCRQRV